MNIKRPSPKQLVPKDAQLVYKGKVFDFYSWQQKMFDGTSATFEGLKRADTTNIIPVTTDGKIILLEQEQPGLAPFVGVVGGRVDNGENPLNAAKRELMEETGYTSSDFVLWDAIQLESKIDWACFTFIARNCQKVGGQKIDAGEKIKLKFVNFDEFLKVAAQDNFRDIEVTVKLFKITQNPRELEKTKKLLNT